jgi:hypothetical protein
MNKDGDKQERIFARRFQAYWCSKQKVSKESRGCSDKNNKRLQSENAVYNNKK